ncbi:DUF4303 domain-containing protein [Pseudoalteromonas aliena]|uniref:DUF4303 domain-containing protein n=1 Tax=Pseudoalteromonas aliena TaxID=247523 RepID=UPI002493FB44|nr:DUF4303 domain-containing protein [Pseudoalteromonas aliena]
MNNIENFEQTLYLDAKAGFTKIVHDHGHDLYVLGFYHTGSYSLLPMFNTLSDLKEVFEEEYDNEEDDFLLAKWNPDDFPSLETYSEYFSSTEEACYELNDTDFSVTDEHAQQHWQQWLQALERVLIRLDTEGVFTNGINRNKVTLAILAYDETEAVQFERIKRINPPAVLESVKTDFETMIASRNKVEQLAMAEFENM